MQLVLASTSPYRKALLEKLRLAFETAAPEIDESAHPGETPSALVERLAVEKAQAVSGGYRDALIIGSDQVAVAGDKVLGKPGNREKARRQLRLLSGKRVVFMTGLCLLNSATGRLQADVVDYTVTFRTLTDQQISRYLELEQPFDSAGSFKSEGLGITLFAAMQGSDPNALIGLPLIRLTSMLAKEGWVLP